MQDPAPVRSLFPLTAPTPEERAGQAEGKVRTRQRRVATLVRFAGVGATGVVVNQLLFWLLVGVAHRHYVLGAVAATQGSTLWNFSLTERWVFPGANVRRLGARLSWFLAVNNSTLLLRVPLLALLLSVLGINYLVSNLLTLLALFLLRFLISDRFIWKAGTPATTTAAAPPATRSRPAPTASPGVFPYRYQVGGFVSVASEIRLRELEYFRVRGLDGDPDIRVRVTPVGEPGLRARPVVTHGQSFVTYEEHLGQRGANFRLDFDDDRIDVAVAPLLGRSPHVVYTNVVEALLRFVLVSRGCLLLHSATVELDGHGVMLTARTDTGKTSTVLRLLRERQGGFLSDDMTIVEPGGRAHCYPKPLTISAHTLQAVAQHTLSKPEQLKLTVQSRLHSRNGRRVGARLGQLNLPIMALNAATQALIPPPKFMVDRLVPCRYLASTEVRELFVIARGASGLEEIDHRRAVDIMLENTDDAYGFPPFRSFAPAISINGDDYGTLRERERLLLARFLAGVRVRRLARDDFSWADAIPQLLNGHGRSGPGTGRLVERSPIRRSE